MPVLVFNYDKNGKYLTAIQLQIWGTQVQFVKRSQPKTYKFQIARMLFIIGYCLLSQLFKLTDATQNDVVVSTRNYMTECGVAVCFEGSAI